MLILSILAFFIIIMHLNNNFSCHVLIIFIYAELQLIFIFMIVWRNFHSFTISLKQSRLWWKKTSMIICDIMLSSFFLLIIFICFAKILMQIMSFYWNYLCDISAHYWLHFYETFVSLILNTQDKRNVNHD